MEPIAIIGIGCRFADITGPEAFFELLKNGVDATREAPEDRWNLRSFYDPDRRIPGKLATPRGGFLSNIDGFDARFFGISPREAACMDPQQRLLLEVTWEAMEDAGLVPERLAGSDVGVFVGGFTLDYKAIQLGYLNRDLIDTHTATGAMMTMLSNRISYTFDFRGPSMSIDTACSSSLVAVHLACASLHNRECSIALAGGVNVMIIPEYGVAESKGGFLAPDGRSKPFSAAANGYGRAEGAGVVVLKPLSAAISDGDPIYAAIRGSAVNQDGHTNGITVPSGEAQQRLILEACHRAGVEPGWIQYVEAHGTGTPVGDPIEIRALATAYGAGRSDRNRCIVGSMKGNIGHAEAGAGVAGLIKAAMCIKNREIPPNLHFDEPNPKIPFDELPLRVPKVLEKWPRCYGPAFAGVNSFGFGGTNAHVVIEEAPCARADDVPNDRPGSPLLFPISARSPEALDAAAHLMRDYARSSAARGIIAILQTLHKHGQPVGSGTLHYFFRKRGDNVSAPTIGRKLRDLEGRGLVTKVSVGGRVLTLAGRKLLHRLEQESSLESSGDQLLRALKRGGRKDIIDQLSARRVIESETTALAASHATAQQIHTLEELIARGYEQVEHGETGIEADTDFHDTVAHASGNNILAALVVMLRSQVWLSHLVAAMRAKVGGRLVVDHEEIVNAIKAHKSDQARKAMQHHLDKLISDVDRYWEQVFPSQDPH
jgi:3-oxoacyl-(acyl-carrier-protein) synthase/DNA-binding FadR family transcriptional regulator